MTSHLTVLDICSVIGQNVFSFMTLHSKGSTDTAIRLNKSTHSLKDRDMLFQSIENRTAESLYFMRGGVVFFKTGSKLSERGGVMVLN